MILLYLYAKHFFIYHNPCISSRVQDLVVRSNLRYSKILNIQYQCPVYCLHLKHYIRLQRTGVMKSSYIIQSQRYRHPITFYHCNPSRQIALYFRGHLQTRNRRHRRSNIHHSISKNHVLTSWSFLIAR